jgi:DNA transposition AAA+ family ATPase
METAEPILETNNFLTIFSACKDALVHKKMISIIGGPGYGKTTALESFRNTHKDIVIYDRAQKSMNAKLFYSSIYNNIVGENYNPNLSTYFLIRKAANKFNEDSNNKLLIIDEAGKFNPEMLEYLHEFRDLTKETTGIVMAGPDYFESNIKTWNSKMRPGIPEIYSRISLWVELKPPTHEESIALAKAYGINDKTFEQYLKRSQDFRQVKNYIMNYLTAKSLDKTSGKYVKI